VADAEGGRRRAQQGRIGAVIKDKWRIDTRLGSGGMATVYAATHRNGNRVAIKMLNLDYSRDPSVRARFLREGYVANAVGHPGAVKVLDDDMAEDGCAFLVMELLEGESLEARRERVGGRLPMQEVFTVGDQLLDLLAAAHPKGIIHRDIKPENVFITHDGSVKLLDFGIARMRESSNVERTGTGLMLGTPDFMSPEQASGRSETIDTRSDLWSVGATMFTLLSGQSVHVSQTLRDHLYATATMRARSLAQAAPHVARPLVGVVDRALELDKERRWPDARAMQDALRWAYKAVVQPPPASEPSGGDSITVHVPSPVEIADEATRVEPMSIQPTSDQTVMHPVPAEARAYPTDPRAPTTPPPTAPPRTDPIPRAFPPDRAPPPPPSYRSAPQPNLQPPPPQAMQGLQIAEPPWFGRPASSESGSRPMANVYQPQATPAPHLRQAPSTLGAQFTDARRTTGAGGSSHGRVILFALLGLVVVLGIVATVIVVLGARDPSMPRARTSPSNSAPIPTGAAPSALGAPAPPIAPVPPVASADGSAPTIAP
jgi:eukaryotic-like serine/threonine-protein kinase